MNNIFSATTPKLWYVCVYMHMPKETVTQKINTDG